MSSPQEHPRPTVQQEVVRPNIVFLFCDQLRADALGCYGNPFVATPAIDAVAARGTRFTSAYVASPVCVPSRCALVTGREPQQTGCFDNGFPMPADVPTFASTLTAAGYRTHAVGKMHFTPNPDALLGLESRDRGEEFGTAQTDDYLKTVDEAGFGFVERPLGLRSEMYYVPQLSPMPAELHHSHWVADRSIDFLRADDRNPEQPFLLWASFIDPHPPFAPPSPWHRLYDPGVMPAPFVPEHSDELLTVHNHLQNRYKFRDGGYDANLVRLIKAYYYATVSFVDYQVGRIVAELERQDLLDNTVIVVSSDHGELLGDYGGYGKRSFLDCSARVPLIMAGPAIPTQVRDEPVSLLDIAPTFAELAGTTFDGDGQNLLQPTDHAAAREAVYGQFQTEALGLYSVITPAYKYTYSAPDRREYLVDRVRDPAESANLAYSPYARETVATMRRLATDHFTELHGRDLATEANNQRLALGAPPDRQRPETYQAMTTAHDACVLVLPSPQGGDAAPGWADYRRQAAPTR